MSDRRLRELERRFSESGAREDYVALNRARVRGGFPALERAAIKFRDEIVHYVKTDEHHRLGPNGKIDRSVDHTYICAPCGAQVFPRHQGWGPVHYTTDKQEITCKTCDKAVRSPKFREGPPKLHLLIKHDDGRQHHLCGGRFGRSTENGEKVACGGCLARITGRKQLKAAHGLNARGRRRLRRRAMHTMYGDHSLAL